MSTFKIINKTNTLGKRESQFNSTLKIDYTDGMEKKELLVKPNETVFLTTTSLPLTLHRMRIKGWVTVDEISKKELKTLMNLDSKRKEPKKVPTNKVKKTKKINQQTEIKKSRYTKKKKVNTAESKN